MTDPAVFCAHTELVDIEKLVPNLQNPNRHPENQIKKARIGRLTENLGSLRIWRLS
jgi:hypothetical protein